MRPVPVILLIAISFMPSVARAEFILQATPSSPLPMATGALPPADHAHDVSERARPVTASGFGREVPLRFAVRQLLPKNWRVRYGQGVDPDRPVSWEGGRPWDYVLRDAVKPLGLHAYAPPHEAYIVQIER